MAVANFVTVTGNLTGDPELNYTGSGTAVLNVTLAYNHYSKEGDGDVSFVPVTIWGVLAENTAATCSKGMRCTVTGIVKQERWEGQDGEERTKMVVIADTFGPDLKWDPIPCASDGDDRGNIASGSSLDDEPF